MKDAVSLIGKMVSIKELNYIIVEVFFVPDGDEHCLYFGLQKADKAVINYSYKDLLPYLKQQIKL